LTGPYAGPAHDWFTSFGDQANTNANAQGMAPPFRVRWIRRFDGTVKHFSTCGGGRLYTHTAEGQIFAVEQDTGRLLWRVYSPGVHVSYTSPLFWDGLLYVPQAGLERSRLRCLDASTGRLRWEAPFTGSPSWNRQQPPIVAGDLVIYAFGSGTYEAKGWLFEHQSTFGFPPDHRPLLRAWNRHTGEVAWTLDFSAYGAGGDDAGMCLLDGTLYYSCYFGSKRPAGVTAAVEPGSGRILWLTTKYAVHAGCTISGKDGRLYLGGYNAVEGDINRIWCLAAGDGSLVWKSEPVTRAIHDVTIRADTLFTHAQYQESYFLDRHTGAVLHTMKKGYRCTRFTVSEPFLLGANLDLYDLAGDVTLIASGPAIDVLLCVGAVASNGRIFFTANGSGLQASLVWGAEAERLGSP
jgi:outer membrane protein assembly factor BamB